MAFVDGDYHVGLCIKKCEDGFGLEEEPRTTSCFNVECGSQRKVMFDDKGTFGLEREIVGARAKLHLDGGEISHAIAHS